MFKWDLNIKDMNVIHTQKLESDRNSQSCKKVKILTFDFEKSNFGNIFKCDLNLE